jgi:poly(A) polymerase
VYYYVRTAFKQPNDGRFSDPQRIRHITINAPVLIPRAEHPISRSLISENALKVLHRLRDAGYAALLVGGCVRDLLLGREPKDFDVVTDARPDEIRKLFHNARVIGRRFRLVHVRFGREIIEVATFRSAGVREWRETLEEDVEHDTADAGAGEEVAGIEETVPEAIDQNIFGTQEEDAVRRDFTVNALYYDIRDRSVIDYVGGMQDLRAGILRMIGDPEDRYREDPVRMLRAVRFAAKLAFAIEDRTAAPFAPLGALLLTVPPARMFEEVLKLFHGGYALETFELLRHYGLFQYLFPFTDETLAHEEGGYPITLVPRAFGNTDARINGGKPVTPAFLFAALLWEPVRERMALAIANGAQHQDAFMRAIDEVLREQLRHTALPKRFSVPMREIWFLQSRFERRAGSQALRLLAHPRFRAAYDFLLLRAECGEVDQTLADWWTRIQEVGEDERRRMVSALGPAPGGKRRRRRRKRSGRSDSRPTSGAHG